MARSRSPEREEARKMWLESFGKLSPAELGEQMDIPAARIRKWKCEDKWSEALAKIERKRGGQPGNKNAQGAGAPLRNRNAATHGAYCKVDMEDLTEEQRACVEALDLDPENNMLRELRLLVAKELYLNGRIAEYDSKEPDTLCVDRVVEMLVPKSGKQTQNQEEKLAELTVEREQVAWEVEQSTGRTDKKVKRLEDIDAEIEKIQDQLRARVKGAVDGSLQTTMKTIMKSSPFERAMRLRAELDKTQGRIIKLLDSIRTYDLEVRRLGLEERKYSFLKQRVTGAFNIDPESGKIVDEPEDMTEGGTKAGAEEDFEGIEDL